ncbi:MAG: prolipoprotein diacylglyceryl transferase family protein [Planctomycetota bacterium]
MRQTLFTIDHYLIANHWILIFWLVAGLAYCGFHWMRGAKSEVLQFLPVYAIGALVIFMVLPKLETLHVNPEDPDGQMVPHGLAIRGYGVFLTMAMIVGVSLVLIRAKSIGVDTEKTLSMIFWMIVSGLVGARLFYVIQKFETFQGLSTSQFLFKLVDMASGGLVVYGSLIGGLVAASTFMYLHKMPWRKVADILAPGMLIGLAIGRLGCLMNGCCFGGVCEPEFPGVYFPAGSPPYMQQLSTGELIGIQGKFDKDSYEIDVEEIEPQSLADQNGVKSGDRLSVYLTHQQRDDRSIRLAAAKNGIKNEVVGVIESNAKSPSFISVDRLPDYSLKTHPTQIYSAINAGFLSAFLWFYFPFRRSDGEVFSLLLLIYPVARFILEMIRQDEAGQFGTSFTISQWVSFGTFGLGVMMFCYVRMQKTLR